MYKTALTTGFWAAIALTAASSAILAPGVAHAEMMMMMFPDSHAPIGVMGGSRHKSGELMLVYRYGRMEMDGNRDGTGDVSTAGVLRDFMVAPLDMKMEMHMIGAMYGLTDDLTLMAMMPYLHKSMNLVRRDGLRFTTRSSGAGDLKLSALYSVFRADEDPQTKRLRHDLALKFGLSLPTGETDRRDDTPLGRSRLPYPMQLGSGTFDPMLGVTYASRRKRWSWGAQADATLRFGNNDEGYRFGNEYALSGWISRNLNRSVSASLRLDGRAWGDVRGRDREIRTHVSPQGTPIPLVPTAFSGLRGGERVDALVGLNFIRQGGVLKGHRLAAEFGFPIYQDLDGPQLETDYRFMLGWQYMF